MHVKRIAGAPPYQYSIIHDLVAQSVVLVARPFYCHQNTVRTPTFAILHELAIQTTFAILRTLAIQILQKQTKRWHYADLIIIKTPPDQRSEDDFRIYHATLCTSYPPNTFGDLFK